MSGRSVVEIDAGYDLIDAKIIVEACRAGGYEVELRERDELGAMPGFISPPTPHRLLARTEDEDAVKAIVQRSLTSDSAPPVRNHPRWARLVALAVAASILIPLSIGVVVLLLRVF